MRTPPADAARSADAPQPNAEIPAVFREAVLRRLCLSAVYNRTPALIAPHALYLKHGDAFIDGVVVERGGKPPAELKLGTFKLAGLSSVTLTIQRFAPQPVFDPTDAKYTGNLLAMVAIDPA